MGFSIFTCHLLRNRSVFSLAINLMPLFCLFVYIQDVALMESMQLGLETVVSAIFDSSAVFVTCSSETKFQLQRILEG